MTAAFRPPAVAGAFYPRDPAELARAIEDCFRDGRRGPGRLPPRGARRAPRPRALIVPHAGFVYSGPIAALAYYRVGAAPPPSSVLMLGVDHHGRGGFALSRRPWVTPLGPVAVDRELVDRLAIEPITIDEAAHDAEHSIEVELPFLQYVVPAPKIAALQVTFASYEELERVADAVRTALADPDLLLIASSDFSHYVSVDTAERLDALALAAIRSRNARALYEVVRRERISMCGIAPVTVLLAALRDEPLTVEILRWGHSAEAEPMDRVVGYAAVTLDRGRLPSARGGGPPAEPAVI